VFAGLPLPVHVALSAAIAASLALYLGPIIIKAAERYGIVDRPSSALKTQDRPVPYLGGIVVFIGFLLALAISVPFTPKLLAILLASSLVVAVGLIDDLGTLTPKDKFIGQIIAAAILVKAGVQIEWELLPAWASASLSVLWLVTAMNAFNIVDVSDGLAGTSGLLGCVGAAAVALMNGEPTVAIVAGALGGACVGFLWFNKEPARIYLGDTGSMLLGVVIGSLAMIGRYSEVNFVSAFFVPLTFLAAPLFDLLLVMVARLRARRPVWQGSPDHFAVRLKHHGWAVTTIATGLALVGVMLFRYPPRALEEAQPDVALPAASATEAADA
jgi:UDP-GlcNAc:undecaprenyl-phosphate GlcNAc-1-phosphate transferase